MSIDASRALLLKSVTERDWQGYVVALARLHGWLVYHPLDSRGSTAGYPDLTMVRDGRLVVAELKSMAGKVSVAQEQWLAAFGAVPGVLADVWRPSDRTTVDQILKGDR